MRRLQLRTDFAGVPLGQALGQSERSRPITAVQQQKRLAGVVVTLRCGMGDVIRHIESVEHLVRLFRNTLR